MHANTQILLDEAFDPKANLTDKQLSTFALVSNSAKDPLPDDVKNNLFWNVFAHSDSMTAMHGQKVPVADALFRANYYGLVDAMRFSVGFKEKLFDKASNATEIKFNGIWGGKNLSSRIAICEKMADRFSTSYDPYQWTKGWKKGDDVPPYIRYFSHPKKFIELDVATSFAEPLGGYDYKTGKISFQCHVTDKNEGKIPAYPRDFKNIVLDEKGVGLAADQKVLIPALASAEYMKLFMRRAFIVSAIDNVTDLWEQNSDLAEEKFGLTNNDYVLAKTSQLAAINPLDDAEKFISNATEKLNMALIQKIKPMTPALKLYRAISGKPDFI